MDIVEFLLECGVEKVRAAGTGSVGKIFSLTRMICYFFL